MKKLSKVMLLILLGFFACEEVEEVTPSMKEPATLGAATYTVSTEAQLKSAVAAANPGDNILVNGTIYLTSTLQLLNSGTSSSKINIYGSSPTSMGVLDCSNVSGWGVKCNGSYWNIQYLDIRNSGDCGLVFQYGHDNYVNWCRFYGNGDSGLQIYNGAYNNWIQSCWSWDNYDVANGGENADGFACKLSAGSGNVFYRCEASHNSDDGWDLYGQPYTVKIYECNAIYNGYGTNGDGNGFKLGSAGQNVVHYARDCNANYNLAWGYDGNGNTGHIYIEGSGGTGNGKGLFTRIY